MMTGALADFIHLVEAPFGVGAPYLVQHSHIVGGTIVALLAAVGVCGILLVLHQRRAQVLRAFLDGAVARMCFHNKDFLREER